MEISASQTATASDKEALVVATGRKVSLAIAEGRLAAGRGHHKLQRRPRDREAWAAATVEKAHHVASATRQGEASCNLGCD